MSSDGRFFLWVAETREGDFIQAFGKEVLDRPGFDGGSKAVVTFAANSSDAYMAPSAGDAHLFRWRRSGDFWELDIASGDLGRDADPGFRLLTFSLGDCPGELLAITRQRNNGTEPSPRRLGPFAGISIIDDRSE